MSKAEIAPLNSKQWNRLTGWCRDNAEFIGENPGCIVTERARQELRSWKRKTGAVKDGPAPWFGEEELREAARLCGLVLRPRDGMGEE